MVAGPIQHYGSHNFHLGELTRWRAQIFPTLASANAEAALAQARLIYIVETQTMYFGRPGAWIPFVSSTAGGPGLGTPIVEVSSPSDLDTKYAAFSLNVVSSDSGSDTITVNVSPAGALDDVEPGDQLEVTGSADNSATPWLDGTYDIVSLDKVTGVIQVAAGTVPDIPDSPASTYGNAEFTDQTFPASGSIAVVNPSPETGGPAIYVYDSGTTSWDNHNSLDARLIFADGSRSFTVLPTTDQVDNPTDPQELIRWGYLQNLLDEIVSGAHDLTDIDSTGPTTVFTFLSDDSYTFAAGDEIVISGHGPADGTHTLTGVTITPGTPDTFEATINTDLGINDSSPAGTASLKRPDSGVPRRSDLATIGGDLTAHINDAGDPHAAAGYLKLSEVQSEIASHEAEADPHAAADYQSGAEVDSTIATHDANPAAHSAAFAEHNDDSSAHNGLLSQIEAFLFGGGGVQTTGVVISTQVVDPNAAYAEPVYRDPTTGFWNVRTSDTDPVHGIALESSELVEKYATVSSIDFTTEGFTLPTAVNDELVPGQFVRFPGATLNGSTIFRITRKDNTTGEFKTVPSPSAETGQTSSLEFFRPLGSVHLVGTLDIANGNTKLPSSDVLRFDIDSDSIKLDVEDGDLVHINPGDEIVVTGSTDNDGTFKVQELVQDSEGNQTILALQPEPDTIVNAGAISSITVASSTITFDVGVDLSEVQPGFELTLSGTMDNDGLYTVDTVDDGTKVVTVTEGMPGTDGGATGTGTIVDPNGTALPGTQHPAEQTFLAPTTIDSIDVDDGSGEAVIQFPASTDLSSVLPDDQIEIVGADDPLNDGVYFISSVNDGSDTVNLASTLAGADQATSGGTGEIFGERETVDGSAIVRKELRTNNFDSSIAGSYGDKFYADSADAEGYSKTVHDWRIGWQSSVDEFIVSIEEEPAQDQAPQEWTAVSDFSSTPPLEEFSSSTFNTIPDWAASTAYSLGDFVKPTTPNGFVYEAVVAGTSGGSEPAFGTTLGADTSDNTVTWRARQLAVIETTSDLTGTLSPGDPIRYTISSVDLYGIIISITATRIAIAGAPIATTDTITDLAYGEKNRVIQLQLAVGGTYGDGVDTDLLANDNLSPYRWASSGAHLVDVSMIHNAADSTSEPEVNVNLNGAAVLSENTNAGLSPSTTWVDNPLGSVIQASYDIQHRESLELEVTTAGGTGDASDLTVMLSFVIP